MYATLLDLCFRRKVASAGNNRILFLSPAVIIGKVGDVRFGVFIFAVAVKLQLKLNNSTKQQTNSPQIAFLKSLLITFQKKKKEKESCSVCGLCAFYKVDSGTWYFLKPNAELRRKTQLEH